MDNEWKYRAVGAIFAIGVLFLVIGLATGTDPLAIIGGVLLGCLVLAFVIGAVLYGKRQPSRKVGPQCQRRTKEEEEGDDEDEDL